MPALGPKNPQLKRLRRLLSKGRDRRDEQAFVIEGPTLIAEALEARLPIETIFAELSVELPGDLVDRLGGHAITPVVDGALSSVLSTVTPQPIAAVATPPRWTWADLPTDRAVLVLVDVRDPGNLGSLWRSAEAAGCAGLVLVGSSVDPTNPKVVRSAAGAAFRQTLVVADSITEAVDALRRQGRRVLAAVLDADCPGIHESELCSAAIVLGNEAHGLDEATVEACDGRLHIPMAGPTESLGVAAAGAVVAFETLRQRGAAGDCSVPAQVSTAVPDPLANPPSPEAN